MYTERFENKWKSFVYFVDKRGVMVALSIHLVSEIVHVTLYIQKEWDKSWCKFIPDIFALEST